MRQISDEDTDYNLKLLSFVGQDLFYMKASCQKFGGDLIYISLLSSKQIMSGL